MQVYRKKLLNIIIYLEGAELSCCPKFSQLEIELNFLILNKIYKK